MYVLKSSLLSFAFLISVLEFPALGQSQTANYLPLFVGAKWVLRNPRQAAPVIFQVTQQSGLGFHFVATYPWGSTEWTLAGRGEIWSMTSYGANGQMMPLNDQPLYLDLTRPQGAQWSNALGVLSVVSRTATVNAGASTYTNCIQIRHQASGGMNLLFGFASGVGYVQFGEGASAFVLDPSASNLPSAQQNPAQPAPAATTPVPVGLTPNPFAYEPMTVAVMTNRFNQTTHAGVTLLVGSSEWAQLEPRPGQYSFEALRQSLSIAAAAHLPVSYTLRVINTVARDVPSDLQNVSWSDPRMRSRVAALIQAIAPLLKGQTKWFTFGYEVDGYLAQHPQEVAGFISLHQMATAQMKQLVPGIKVSCTLTYSGVGSLFGLLAALNQQMDYLAVTYCPLKPDFTVEDPSVLIADFKTMNLAAGSRKLMLQEIAYPTAAATGGSEDKQAEFYTLAFQQVAAQPSAFEGMNFMVLADLSQASTLQYAKYYGLTTPAFEGALQTIGMFDALGNPKKGWAVFSKNAASIKSQAGANQY
jgi:hypothetical protein